MKQMRHLKRFMFIFCTSTLHSISYISRLGSADVRLCQSDTTYKRY